MMLMNILGIIVSLFALGIFWVLRKDDKELARILDQPQQPISLGHKIGIGVAIFGLLMNIVFLFTGEF